MEFDLENPLTILKEHQFDTLDDLFASEDDHMPSTQSFKTSDFYLSFRQEAISVILQAQYSCNYDPFLPYLAVNYMDRFICRQEILQGKPWIQRLVAISCLSLAAKMKNTHFSLSNFQSDGGFFFDTQTINRMENLILDALNWRMRSITPFSFINYFISLFEPKDPPPLLEALKDRATEIIFTAHNEIKLLEFKPSVIAASALLVASHQLFPVQFSSFNCAISSCGYVNKEKLLKCFKEMVEMECYESMSSTRTPPSVIDRRQYCTRSEIEITPTNITISTDSVTTAERREMKRRKMNGYAN